MRRVKPFLPGKVDLILFAVLALISATIVSVVGQYDAGLAFAAFPIFVFCAVWGLWKHGRLSA